MLKVFDRRNASAAEGWMFVVFADVGFPMPAAFAFLAVGFGNRNRGGFANCDFQGRNVDQFAEQLGIRILQLRLRNDDFNLGVQGLANRLGLA